MALGKRRRQKGAFIPPKLQITSMMDMFTIILIFLLFSFSDKQETLSLDNDLQLPTSNAKLDYNDSIKLVLTKTQLQIDDKVVAKIRDGQVQGLNPNDLKASELYKQLESRKKNDDRTREDEEKDTILFLCDKRLSFDTINSIVKTAGMAGYPNFQFGVLKK
ncbi:MAG: biopolymer transporter ExbD [Proteobacteria bacterium]|nr:biopolymer transporter ExbD [Pseudomonadota bacterium]